MNQLEILDALLQRVKFWAARCSLCEGKGWFMQYRPLNDNRKMDCDRCKPDRDLIAQIEGGKP